MIEADLVTRLKTITPHVYALEADDGFELPLIVYTAINAIPIRDMSSAVATAIITFQIDCYDADYLSAKAMARQARNLITAWHDAGPVIQDERDMIDKTAEKPIYRTMLNVHLFDRGD